LKYLIDECLSPNLATLARDQGHPDSTHISWLGLAGQPDWAIARRAIDEGYVLVTHNTVDFRPLYGREDLHGGLIGFNTPPKVMTLLLQKRLFLLAMTVLAGDEPYNAVIEITVDQSGQVRIEQYTLSR
jgi:predicted nuclease of predicted toxin-antitoxin system